MAVVGVESAMSAPAPQPKLPEAMTNAERLHYYHKEDLPNSGALDQVLLTNGIDTRKWGQGTSKNVRDFWKEINLDEASLECYTKNPPSSQTNRKYNNCSHFWDVFGNMFKKNFKI